MNKEGPSIGRVAVISGFALSCFGLLLFLWLAFGGPAPLGSKGYRVKVALPDAATLANQSDVRIAGVTVGKVVKKELGEGVNRNRTVATLELKRKFVPLRRDSKAMLRQKTLLGETYVELSPGSPGAPALEEGDTLPPGGVVPTVEFDELLRIFDEPTRDAFRAWQRSAADAGENRSRDLNDGLGNLPVFTENAQSVVDVLGDRREALRALVRNAGTTFEALTRNQGSLGTLIRRNTQVFDDLSSRRNELAESIQIFPTFFNESRATLARLASFSTRTEPLIRDLDPLLKDTQPTLNQLGRTSPDLRKLFNDLLTLTAASRTGLPALSRTLSNLDPTLKETGSFLQQLNPILRFLEYNQVKISDFINIGPSALAGIRSTPKGSKSNGHVLPQLIMAGEESLPAISRSPANRGNTYLSPGELADPNVMGISAFDCARSGEKGPGDTPGCKIAKNQTFQGLSTRFPHVRPNGPGGAEPATGP